MDTYIGHQSPRALPIWIFVCGDGWKTESTEKY